MLRRFSTMLVILLTFSLLGFAQDKVVLKPIGATFISKTGQAPEILVQNKKEVSIVQNNLVPPPVQNINVLGTIDTLSYRKIVGGNFNTNFGAFGQDLLVQWFEAPADLTIKAIGATFSDNVNGTDGSFKIYKVGNGITLDDLKSQGPGAIKQGRFTALDPSYVLGFVGFEDESDGSGYIAADGLTAFPFAEDIWSDVGFGYPLTPIVSPSTAPVYQYVETINFGFEPTLLRGEIFAVIFKNESQNTNQGATDDRIGLWSVGTSGNPDFYGWKFYVNGRTTAGDVATAYWYSREFTWDIAAIVDLTGDRPPVISNVSTLGTTPSTADRSVSATIVDDNPSGSTPGGVTAAVVQWSIDGGTTWNDAAMTAAGDVYTGSIPGQSPGTAVTYRIMATDDNTNSSDSPPKSYSIFQKTKDVLFIYNNTEFSTNTARRLYIGGSTNTPYIIDGVANDIWTSTDGTAEAADVMSLYKWVVQVDGSYPDADFSDAAKAYLDGATAGNERNYFFSSQDYGCLITGNCADVTFAAGDFQYDYLGVSTLGPQDLSGAIVGLEGVASDPISGWVAQYAADSGVGFYYDPSYELGFTSYIDALTPGNGGVAAYTSDGAVVGVHNEGANWKTTFLTYDYAAANFRSDTSVADHSDAGYAWGITIGNQVLAFLTWSGYVTGIEPIQGAVPTEYSLDQNFPNPFNPTTSIRFSIPQAGNVTLAIYDVLGRKVTDLVNSYQQAGSFNATWDGTNQFGSKVSSGTYFYQLKSDNGFTQTKKMVLLK